MREEAEEIRGDLMDDFYLSEAHDAADDKITKLEEIEDDLEDCSFKMSMLDP